MMSERQDVYAQEQQRLDETLSIVEQEIAHIREEIKQPTDDYVRQMVNAQKAKDLRYLEEHGREKPYFGRIDFRKRDADEVDSVYIGKRGIVRSDNFDSVVVDWRAPIASLYYSGESRDAFYRTGNGLVRGEVKLKRNFAIDQGRITGIYDGALKETIRREMGDPNEFLEEGYIDEFLAASLNQTNDSRLKDIVATIQAEQNDIIRAEKDRPVIVQGVAGSGKTTIALHRLSYLIYNYQDSLASKRFMVFAPNQLFLNYISDVLPELGVEDVQQATFLDWAAKLVKGLLPKGWRIQDPNKSLLLFFEPAEGQEETREIARWRLQFKGSLACKEMLEAYIRYLETVQIPYKNLTFAYKPTGEVFRIAGSEIRQLFSGQFGSQPYHVRVQAMRKHLKQEMNKQMFAHLRERRVDLDKQGLARIERLLEQILDGYFAAWPAPDVFPVYRMLLGDLNWLRTLVPDTVPAEHLEAISRSSREIFDQERIEPEDVAPLLYLQHLLVGLPDPVFDHAVVDEAQDLSALEIAVIALMTKKQSVTIVGDIAQGIHAYRGLTGWDQLLEGIFTERQADYYTLEQSYRSTVEIMQEANRVLAQIHLPGLVLAKPVLRHGEAPEYLACQSRSAMMEAVIQRIRALQQEGMVTIAVVTKSLADAKKAQKLIGAEIPEIELLSSKNKSFPGGITVMPAFLTKGLQFDAVILLDVDEAHYGCNEEDAKLLYVAMTRPVHRLTIAYVGEQPSSLLQA